MALESIRNQVKVFYKKVNNNLDKDISEGKCNIYIKHIEEIKENLSNEEQEWIEDFVEIEQFGQGFFSEPAISSDIKKTMNEIHEQLDQICLKLGIETEEPQNNEGIPQQVFNISQSQSQSTDVKIDIKIEGMVKEFEKEISKLNPDKSKLKIIMGTILKHGATYAPRIIELLIKYWDKIKFGGFGFL